MNPDNERLEVRVDKWLWAARFYKIRSLASEAVKGGHVNINGERGKASKSVHIGDVITVVKGSEQFIVRVTGLADKRGSATIAEGLYEETKASITARAKLAEQRKFKTASAPAPDKRPDKRARRQITRFKESGN